MTINYALIHNIFENAHSVPSDWATHQTVDHLFRHEAGKMVAVLVKLFGFSRIDIAEDLVQETLLTALHTWKLKGIPDQPQAWLYRVAKNNALNYLRREQHFNTTIAPQVAYGLNNEQQAQQELHTLFLDREIEDAQLRIMFACCHPALHPDVQLILVLKTLCGLSTREIAAALLSQEDAVAKRLYRAKEKIKMEQIALEVPIGVALGERLDAVLQAIYLLFNEGYKASHTNTVIRHDLSEEAIRLGLLLHTAPIQAEGYNRPKINALMALMCFHAARFDSRLDAAGNIILLEHQNRSLWDTFLTQKAMAFFKLSAEDSSISSYHIEAAIASYHAHAKSFEQTNWQAIYYCYNLLYAIKPTHIVAFNRAIARGYHEGAQAGIAALLEIEGMDKSHLYHTALGDFYAKNQQPDKARTAYLLALEFVVLQAERQVITAKMDAIGQ